MVVMTELDETTTAVLTASRALLAVVARSVAPVLDRVTVPQFRVLVVLSNAETPMRHGDLAGALGLHSSTFTRTTDRLITGGWVERRENPDNRRETLVNLTPAGHEIVARVTEARRAEIRAVLERLPAAERAQVRDALELFYRAAGEPSAPVLAEFTV
jgi:DNA-binding MarR family transcriptional regulator